MKKLLTLVFALFLGCNFGWSQIHINEYSASNLASFPDGFNRYEDWIELHNSGSSDMDLTGYHLSDKASKPGKYEIPSGTIIEAGGFLTFWCSGRDVAFGNDYHTNFKLSQTTGKDIVLLSDPNETVIDQFDMELTLVETSRCRSTNNGDTWVVCTNPTPGASNNNTTQYAGYTVPPSMDMEAGFYEGEVTVTITNNEPNSILRYTTNGHNPNAASPVYSMPIVVTETTVIKAQSFSFDPNILPGKMDFNTYFIDEDFTLAVFSVAADRVQDLANGQGEVIPIGSIEYFTTEKTRDATSFGSLNRHGQDSWVLDHRSLDWVSRDEMGYSKAVNAPIFSYSERDEYQKFMFRNSGDDNYPARDDAAHEGSTHIRDEYVQQLAHDGGLKLDRRAVERVIVFLNGDYWGVYGMRERPVDHDYTGFYYDQGKYEVQYLTTWGTTEAQYGGSQAFSDWYRLRNFILEEDMSDPANYEKVKDELNTLSLIDYLIVNLNCVASDWMNYNTGWWRGLNPDGDHKKWGYILWDLDATFDYYINYSGVPNTDPDAVPCDIGDISNYMDQFWGGSTGGGTGGGGNPIADPSACASISNSSSPYTEEDTIFLLTIAQDNYCCNFEWDGICQDIYDDIEEELNYTADDCASVIDGTCPYPSDDPFLIETMINVPQCCDNWGNFCNNAYNFFANGGFGGSDGGSVSGNVGMHEKIFLKLQEESPEFKQLYYSRQADLMNTVYTCENMMTTLEEMLAVIEPEMPRQIERWGGTMEEWQTNVQRLKDFISERCELFDDGMTECYELEGPFDLTLMVEPAGAGTIELNTIDVEEFPWKGGYFGGMDNKIKAKTATDDWEFSHWISNSGNMILPNELERKAVIQLTTQDTLTAVFKTTTGISEIEKGIKMNVYPNPTSGRLNIKYELEEAANVEVVLTSIMGQEITKFPSASGYQTSGSHSFSLDVDKNVASAGVYILQLNSEKFNVSRKVSIIN